MVVFFSFLMLMKILTLLLKYLVIFHADPCNKSCTYMYIYVERLYYNRLLEKSLVKDDIY